MSEPLRLILPVRADGKPAIQHQRIVGRRPFYETPEGFRISLRWFCGCDNDEELNQLIHVGENNRNDIEAIRVAFEHALQSFMIAVEHHRAKRDVEKQRISG